MHEPLLNIEWADKYVGERRKYNFTWTPALATGDAIEGDPTIEVEYGDVTLEEPTFADPTSSVFIVGGTHGAQAVRLRANTASGEIVEAVATFRVL